MAYQKIALLGKGNLGSAVLEQLVSHKFSVTVLSRDPSKLENSLIDALKGHDVALSTIAYNSIPLQKDIIDACIAAGIKRFIPSDFSGISTDPKAANLPPYVPMAAIHDYLKAKAESDGLEYTIFSIGAFLEFILDTPFFVDWPNRSVELFDDGTREFSCTSVSGIGKAVAGSLKQAEETKNKNVFIHEAVLSQVKLLELAKKHGGGEWTEKKLDAADELAKAIKKVEDEGTTDPFVMLPLVKACLMAGKYTASYPKVDNEVLGLSLLSEKELEDKVAAKVKA